MYIELHRAFRVLRPKEHSDKGAELANDSETLTLNELLQERRAVLLSEGGSGKTCELLEAVKRLREEGKAAFFIRLEHVAERFDGAFDAGDMEEFNAWLKSTENGWLLLDSIDESRLRSPQDFSSAMRVVSTHVSKAKDRIHVLVSGRPSAWRPQTDLALCNQLFSLANDRSESPEQNTGKLHRIATNAIATDNVFKVVTLESLSRTQVEVFALAKGIEIIRPFLNAIERGDAWSFTQRPQDLEELTEYWLENGKLGSRLEWMTASVNRRLQESQDRADARPLTPARARHGVEQLAAALILTRTQNIRVPDGSRFGPGLDARQVLGWVDSEIGTLLQRPLFDQDVYGTVRFHHRSVLEYLAAQWFSGLLRREVSRQRVENLFFREQYGVQVVVPSLRPILPWLSITDDRIVTRLSQVAPEVVFEGGDPLRLPISLRIELLEKICEQLVGGISAFSVSSYGAIQRFAAPDVSNTVQRLIHKYKDNEEVVSFLMRMIWQGNIVQALPEALEAAGAATTSVYVRIAAFHAVDAIGMPSDMAALRAQFSREGDALNRRCMAELLSLVQEPNATTLRWVMDCLPRLEEFNEHDSTGLSKEMARFFERADVALSAEAIGELYKLLIEPPIIDLHFCQLSARHRWLRRPAGVVMSRLLRVRDEAALLPCAVAILHLLTHDVAYDPYLDDIKELNLPQLVQEWPAIKWAWLWHNIEQQRVNESGESQRVVNPWLAWSYMRTVNWDQNDFELAIVALIERPLADDQLVALEIAFRLYVLGDRQPVNLRKIELAVSVDTALQTRLQQLLNPPEMDEAQKKWERRNVVWNRLSNRRAKQFQRRRRVAVEILATQLDTLRDPGFDDPTAISDSQAYLLEQMRRLEENRGLNWTLGHWRSLETEFGVQTAMAFRDGMVAYWRKNVPQLISEGAQVDKMQGSDLFGLTGLTIEAAETPMFISTLSSSEARIAFRYAMRELNGFPYWFADLCTAHSEIVTAMALTEVEFELKMDSTESASQYLVADIRQTGEWLGNRIAPELIHLLIKHRSKRPELLEHLVDIILASELSDEVVSKLASSQLVDGEPVHRSLWAAAWTSVEPGPAIDALQRHIQTLSNLQQCTNFIMAFATHLLGSRTRASRMRTAFQTASVLKRLYLLIHQHVRSDEDIDRSGKGVYSPGLRDNAQDAREHLVRMLGAIQGHESFLALQAISEEHPHPRWRPWFVQQAIAKAQADSERPAWSAKQVSEFADTYECVPVHHRELFDLAVMRLLDLKHEMEDSDLSTASVVVHAKRETELRNWIAAWCSRHANGRFSIPQEHELPDAKRPDLQWACTSIDGAVPVELKIADNWTGPQLFERLENQLAGDYLRDKASSRGIYLLIWRGIGNQHWQLSDGKLVNFSKLVGALQAHWKLVAVIHPQVEEIQVIGIDLTKRASKPD